jgi:5-formyltetrahydrofolate cyclo-ligase
VKIGLVLPLFSGDAGKVLAFARRAERLGYDGVFAFDHFFPPGGPRDRASLEAFSMLAAVAAATERITVGTLVTRASLRPAGLLAKLAASLDDVSRGRLVLGIGTGDPIDRPEHDAFGLTYYEKAERRLHLVETVRAVKALLAGRTWEGGDRVGALDGPILPAPRRAGGPPVWIGGFADAIVRLAAAEADAWNGWGMSIPAFAAKANLLRRTAAEAGRTVEATWAGIVVVGRDEDEAGAMLNERYRRNMLETDVWAGSAHSLIWWLEGLGTAGASWAVLVPAGPPDRVEMIAEEVFPHMRRPPGIPSHRLKQAKRRLRREVLALRDAIPEADRARRSRAIAARLLALPELEAARTVLAFSSFGSEVDTGPVVEALVARGLRVALPRIEEGELVPVAYRPGDPVRRAAFGALEPSAGAVVPDAEIDVVIAPGVAFDRSGGRLGYGGGYYDRFLLRLPHRPPRIAVAFAEQVVDEVPSGRPDLPVDVVVTERDIVRCVSVGAGSEAGRPS